jgi:hypothetical protein
MCAKRVRVHSSGCACQRKWAGSPVIERAVHPGRQALLGRKIWICSPFLDDDRRLAADRPETLHADPLLVEVIEVTVSPKYAPKYASGRADTADLP